MQGRVTPLDGIHNLRDYGGYGAADGCRLRTGLLYRSGQHQDATSADLDAVAALSLRTIIDLRGDSERRLYPCARPAGFSGDVLFVPGETAGTATLAPHEEAARTVVTAAQAHERMVGLYASLPFRPNLVAAMRLYLAALAERDGASLIHCLAGKDRTGVAVAVLHALMGVHADDTMADYLLTNSAGNIERRIEAGARIIRANVGANMDDGAVRTVMSVHPDYLETAFSAIRERHGDVATYAEAELGATPERRAALAARLLV